MKKGDQALYSLPYINLGTDVTFFITVTAGLLVTTIFLSLGFFGEKIRNMSIFVKKDTDSVSFN